MTKKKCKIITAEEFFRLREMFNGLDEDVAMAVEIYKNSNYDQKEILDILMAKALVFKPRRRFCDAIKFSFILPSHRKIYAFMKESEADEIYFNILKDI